MAGHGRHRELVRYGRGIRTICVITWNADRIRPWVTAMKPDVLGDGSDWKIPSPDLEPIVVETLRGLTLTLNHNNTISAGFEKDHVVGILLALRDARIPKDADAMQGWALAHGWSGKNPERPAQYVRHINGGKRPRVRHVLRTDYIDYPRQRLASGDDLAFVSLAGRPFRAENALVVACRRRGSMVHSGRDLAGRWGSRCGPFTVSFAENED